MSKPRYRVRAARLGDNVIPHPVVAADDVREEALEALLLAIVDEMPELRSLAIAGTYKNGKHIIVGFRDHGDGPQLLGAVQQLNWRLLEKMNQKSE